MERWQLKHEGRCIQNHLCNPRKFRDKASQAKTFMSTGKTNRALRMLSSSSSSGVLGLDDIILELSQTGATRTVREILIEKHPTGKAASPSSLLQGLPISANPILFEELNRETIRKAAQKTKGAAGISGLDAAAWRRLCCSFKASTDLCSALASVGKRLCIYSSNQPCIS